MTTPERRTLRYAVAAVSSAVLVGLVLRYPEVSGVEGPVGWLVLAAIVVFAFAAASDRVRRSRYVPFVQAGFFLAWGGYEALRGRWGLLTLVLLGGGVLTVVWEGVRALEGTECDRLNAGGPTAGRRAGADRPDGGGRDGVGRGRVRAAVTESIAAGTAVAELRTPRTWTGPSCRVVRITWTLAGHFRIS